MAASVRQSITTRLPTPVYKVTLARTHCVPADTPQGFARALPAAATAMPVDYRVHLTIRSRAVIDVVGRMALATGLHPQSIGRTNMTVTIMSVTPSIDCIQIATRTLAPTSRSASLGVPSTALDRAIVTATRPVTNKA